jgi:hypothetical protein
VLHPLLLGSIQVVTVSRNFKQYGLKAWLKWHSTMATDPAHVLASSVYDPDNCSNNFQDPLHTCPANGAYLLLLVVSKLRIIGVLFLYHTGLDRIKYIV